MYTITIKLTNNSKNKTKLECRFETQHYEEFSKQNKELDQ